MDENEAALIIQLFFRQIVLRKKKSHFASYTENCNIPSSGINPASKTVEDLKLFQETLNAHLKRKKKIQMLYFEIEEIVLALKAIKKLEDCRMIKSKKA